MEVRCGIPVVSCGSGGLGSQWKKLDPEKEFS